MIDLKQLKGKSKNLENNYALLYIELYIVHTMNKTNSYSKNRKFK